MEDIVIVGDVTPANPLGAEEFCAHRVRITPALWADIHAMVQVVKDHGGGALHEVRRFDYAVDYHAVALEAEDSALEAQALVAQNAPLSVEVPFLCVTDNAFHWIAVAKHHDDCDQVSTDRIPLAVLELPPGVYRSGEVLDAVAQPHPEAA